jgi:hypothetical protein
MAAGVKHFIPAEWGFNTHPGKLSGAIAMVLGGKTKTVDYLIEQTKLHPALTWTGLAAGPFLDWVCLTFPEVLSFPPVAHTQHA